jgi:hypothetical protein
MPIRQVECEHCGEKLLEIPLKVGVMLVTNRSYELFVISETSAPSFERVKGYMRHSRECVASPSAEGTHCIPWEVDDDREKPLD